MVNDLLKAEVERVARIVGGGNVAVGKRLLASALGVTPSALAVAMREKRLPASWLEVMWRLGRTRPPAALYALRSNPTRWPPERKPKRSKAS